MIRMLTNLMEGEVIQKLFNHPHVLYQTYENGIEIPEPAIAGCVDAGGFIVITQEDRDIVLNPASVPELCTMLKKLKNAAKDKKK